MSETHAPLVADRVVSGSPVGRVRAGACRRTINEYLVQMSHELRTPLNAIIGMSGLILEGEPDAKQRQYAKGVYAAGETLSAILNDVLDLSRIAENCLTIEPIRFDLRSMVEETAKALTPRAEDRGLALRVDWRPDVPRQVSGDPGRIRQVLGNLVGHALHATSRGEVVIQVATDADTRAVLFSIADTGVGIPAARMERVFDEYVPVDASPYRSFCVTGLGLRISAELVRVMGGEIGAESVIGQGSSFWFSLPLIAADAAADRTVPPALDWTGGRALVVEQDHLGRERFSHQIEAAGWRIDFAEELSQVAEILEDAHRSGDGFSACIFGDYAVRPGHEELARRLKADVSLQHIALVMVTAVGSPGEGKRLWHAGFAAYLRKPLPNDELREALVALEQLGRDGRGPSLITRHSLAEAKSAQSLPNDEGLEEVLASLWLDSNSIPVDQLLSPPEPTESIEPVIHTDHGVELDPATVMPALPFASPPADESVTVSDTGLTVARPEAIEVPEPPVTGSLLTVSDEPISDEAELDGAHALVEPVSGLVDEGFAGEMPSAQADGLLPNGAGWDLGADQLDEEVTAPGLVSVGESMWEGAPDAMVTSSLIVDPPIADSIPIESIVVESAEPQSPADGSKGVPETTEESRPEWVETEAVVPSAPVAFAQMALVHLRGAAGQENDVVAAAPVVEPAVEARPELNAGFDKADQATGSAFELTSEEPPVVQEDEPLVLEREGDSSVVGTLETGETGVAELNDAAQFDMASDLGETVAEAKPTLPTALRSAVVSEAILQQLARGGSPLATQLVATFLREAPARISEVAISSSRGDLARARQSLVALKGMCGLLGAAQLSDAVAVAHQAAGSGDIAPVAGELGRIEQAFLEVRLAVEQATPAGEAGAPPPPIDGSFLEQLRSGAGARRPTMATRLAETFLAETPGWMSDLGLAAENEDGAAVQRLAQMLKATASIIGAQGLVSRAAQIEASARLTRFDEVGDGVGEARREAERVAEALRSSM